jgi:zinc-ribbon domain
MLLARSLNYPAAEFLAHFTELCHSAPRNTHWETKQMFCNRCGTEIPEGSMACSRCGRRIGDPVRAIAQSRLERHLRTLGVLWIVVGGLFSIPAVGLLIFSRTVHLIVDRQEPWAPIFPLFLTVAGGTLLILATGGICVGLGLMQRRSWARVAAIILGVLSLFHPPLGTALGVYTLWVLLADDHGDEYRYLAHTS